MREINRLQEHEGHVVDSVNDFDVIECKRCKFKHIVPIPMQEELEKIYYHDYYSKEKSLYFERHKEDLEWWNLVYSDRYDTFEEYILGDEKLVLDVGSGPGYFLLHGKKRGWETLGIEPSKQAANYSRGLGLEIVEDFLTEEMAKKLKKFDVVHLSEVLEHIPDPINFIKLIRSLLKPNALICVVVPNDYNVFQLALRKACEYDPWWVVPPHHINYFNFQSLKNLLESLGFKIVLQESTFPIDIFLLMGENYVGNDKLGRQCHNKRKLFERNLHEAGFGSLKRQFYQAMSNHGIGREIVLLGRVLENKNQ